jgi:integrase
MSTTASQSASRSRKKQRRPDSWYSAGGKLYRRGRTAWGYWSQDEGRVVKAGTSKAEAEAARADYILRRGRGERVVAPPKLTVTEAFERWWGIKADRLDTSTRTNYRAEIDLVHIPYFGRWKLGAVTVDAIAKLQHGLAKQGLHFVDPSKPVRPLKRSTIDSYMRPLQGMLAHAARRGWISASPFPQLTRDDRPKPDDDSEPVYEWSDDDVRRLLDASAALAAKPTSRFDYTPIITLALDSGCRQSELMGLVWGDVDLAEGVINVRQQFGRAREISAPKTKAGRRRVPLVPSTVAMLRKHRLASKFSTDSDYVFASRSGAPLQHRNLTRRGWEAARDAAGLPQMGFHQTRHCFASRAIAAGVPVQMLAEVLGHRDPSVTLKVYAHLFDRRRSEDAFRAAMGGVS